MTTTCELARHSMMHGPAEKTGRAVGHMDMAEHRTTGHALTVHHDALAHVHDHDAQAYGPLHTMRMYLHGTGLHGSRVLHTGIQVAKCQITRQLPVLALCVHL